MENQPLVPMIQPTGKNEIDLVQQARALWRKRMFILKAWGIGAVVGLVIAYSIPNEYKTEVKLAPENIVVHKAGQLGGLAAMAGIDVGPSATGADALYPDLYPDIVKSTPFLLELIDIPVETKQGDLKITLFEYLQKHQQMAWWKYMAGAPSKVLGTVRSLLKKKDGQTRAQKQPSEKLDPFDLTQDQEGFIRAAGEKIAIHINKKNGIISASVTMQDPLVSAIVIEVVLDKLQSYITDYRTRKAKRDLAFSEKLYYEAKENYYNAQKAYAGYVDENRNVVSASYRIEEGRLRNEMELAYGVYNQMAQQLEINKIKVQEQTPVYTVIEPARIPLSAASPNKFMWVARVSLLFALVSLGWVILRNLQQSDNV